MKNNSNKAILAGEVRTEPESYSCCGENFYSFYLAVKRDSGAEDVIPVNISQILIEKITVGDKLCFNGQVRTYNKLVDGKNKLIIVYFAQEVKDYVEDRNEVDLTGFFCKKPIFRTTPLGREICDVLLAVNRERGKSDYIPCIVWGRTAQHIGSLEVGAKANVQGRIQSRIYNKAVGYEVVQFTAYELSVNRIQEAIEEVVV